jgi:hypothetical protein
MTPAWRAYDATERAAIFQITYHEYRRLGLRRSGCAELDAAERRRRTKQRYNAKRRMTRHANRVSMSADCAPSNTVGTVRGAKFRKPVVSRLVSSDIRVREVGNQHEWENRRIDATAPHTEMGREGKKSARASFEARSGEAQRASGQGSDGRLGKLRATPRTALAYRAEDMILRKQSSVGRRRVSEIDQNGPQTYYASACRAGHG